MTARAKQLLDEVLSLPDNKRHDFLHRLLHAVGHENHGFADEETAAAWDAEIAKRIEEIDSGKVKMVSSEEFWAMMRQSRAKQMCEGFS
jgi:hypothetical protein